MADTLSITDSQVAGLRTALTYPRAPRRVYWELTRACDLACEHCRAEAMPRRSSEELTTDEAERVLQDLAAAAPKPHVIFTGGDPLKRPDLLDLVGHATDLGLAVALAPSATPALSADVVRSLKAAGVTAMSLSIDGPTAAQHDRVRGVLGCFGWTLAAAAHIRAAGIPLQVNTLLSAETLPYLDGIGDLVARLGAERWSLFALVPVGRATTLTPLTAAECELAFRWLVFRAPAWPFVVTTTEAPHYRRVLIQHWTRKWSAAGRDAAELRAHPLMRGFGIRDGNGVMFIAANGDVTPSGFLPIPAGNVRRTGPLAIYREAPLFRRLRAPSKFHGRCGACGFRMICGGSRARAFAASGDVLGDDPLCAWDPAGAVVT